MFGYLKLNQNILWLFHILILIGGCGFLWQKYQLPVTIYLLYLGSLTLTLAIYLTASSLSRLSLARRTSKVVYLMVCSILIFAACIFADNVHSYGPIVADTVHAVYQTSISESLGYINNFVSSDVVLISVIWTLLVLFSGALLTTSPEKNIKLLASILIAYVAGFSLAYMGKEQVALVIAETLKYEQTLAEFSDTRAAIMDDPEYSKITSDFNGNVIIVIGESSSRQRFGIYNYARNTTPLLGKIKDQLHIFNDIISTHSHTVPSLTDALTLNSRNNRKSITELADIVDVAKKAGYYTGWLSNQNAVGVWDNEVAAIGRQADLVKYHDPSSGTTRIRSVFDMALVNSTKEFLNDKKHTKKLVFVHLMATHFPYCDVVPKDFARDFMNYDGIKMDYSVMGLYLADVKNKRGMEGAGRLMYANDCYDKAVRYVDLVVSSLIETARTQQKPTLLLYFSDHGEAPLLGTAHESRMHSHFHVEIPFFIWTNKAYQKHFPQSVKAIANSRLKPGSLKDFSYYIADLAQIKGITDTSSRSIFSTGYEVFARKTLHEKISYDNFDENADYSERTRANLNEMKTEFGPANFAKVWAHRVDSLGAMMEAKELFAGVEMDVVFDAKLNKFFIYHPPAPNVGLTLSTQLREDNGKVHYWLDWKNADTENLRPALERLTALDNKYDIKKRVILESGKVFKDIATFKQSGWNTSYYLPTEKITECIQSCDDQGKSALAKQLLENRDKAGYRTVSFDARFLEFYQRYMARQLNKEGVKVYIWDPSIDISGKNALQRMEKYIKNSKVGVLLVGFPSPFDL